MKVIGIIPARYDSTRFPGKVLVPINGVPMVARVYYQALKSKYIESALVGTDSIKVFEELSAMNIPVRMTKTNHRSGTERIAEISKDMDRDIIVNIQGDEPFIEPKLIDYAVHPFLNDSTLKMGTVARSNLTDSEWIDPNIVKVRISQDGYAEEFFRLLGSESPSDNDYKHIGLYVYRKEFLLEYVCLPPSDKELELHLEQMRALDNNVPIKVAITKYDSIGINTPDDLNMIEKLDA